MWTDLYYFIDLFLITVLPIFAKKERKGNTNKKKNILQTMITTKWCSSPNDLKNGKQRETNFEGEKRVQLAPYSDVEPMRDPMLAVWRLLIIHVRFCDMNIWFCIGMRENAYRCIWSFELHVPSSIVLFVHVLSAKDLFYWWND